MLMDSDGIAGGRTKEQLYNEARQRGVKGARR
jgi:hypothetical protein